MYKEAAPDFKALNGTPFLQIFTFYAKANVLMINEIKSCERLQKLLDDNAKLRAVPNERKSTADSCSTGCKHSDVHSRGWRRSHHHILPLIIPIVELQGTLRKDTELVSVACSQAAHVTLRLKKYRGLCLHFRTKTFPRSNVLR